MKHMQTDVAVLGAGTAGLTAYRAAKAAGARAVIIERGDDGTTCARSGCMPSKLLIAAASAAHAVARAPGFGIHIDGSLRVDGHAVMRRVVQERDRFVGLVIRDMESIPDADRVRGHARFVDNHTIAVGNHTVVTSKCAVIATGSQAQVLDSLKVLGDRVIISDNVFDWDDLPEAVAVIGAGIIGLELGQALHRLGVRVAIFGRGGTIGPIGDPAILDYATTAFNEEFTLEPEAEIGHMGLDGGRVAITRTAPDGSRRTDHFDFVLAATGRNANVHDIGLEKTSLTLDAHGLPSSDPATTRMASADGVGNLFIAGDASDLIPLLHEAVDAGRLAGMNAARLALGQIVTPGQHRAPLGIVFTDPQIGIVGGGWRALHPGTYAIGQSCFEDRGRSRIQLRNKGLLNVYGDLATNRFLGAEMLAPDGEHLAHLLAWALQNRMTVAQMLGMPFYHPVIEEGLRTALGDLDARLREQQALNRSPVGRHAR